MIFLWGGFGLYVLIHNRAWLSKWSFYVSGLITLLIFYPVIDWNIKQDFITYRFHSDRVSHANQGFNINSFTQFVLGQFFYSHLLLFPLFMFSLWKAITEKQTKSDHFKLLLIYVSVPLLLVSTYLACFDTVLPHWTGPSYLGISLLTAWWIGKNEQVKKYNSWLKVSSIFSLTIAFLGVLTISFYPGTLGKKGSYDLGSGDFTLDMYGWNQAKNKMDSVLKSDIKNKRMKADAPFVCHKWFPAAHEDFYICKPLNRTMLVLGDTIDIHQYLWLNNTKQPLKAGDDAYVMVPSNYYDDPYGRWKDYFVTIEKADTLTITRLGKVVKKMMITRLRNYKEQ
jgi:hypothetical protein